MVTETTIFDLKKPTVSADSDVWGDYLNDSLDYIDQFLGAITTAGGTTAFTLTTSAGIGAYATGMTFRIKMNATNTGASTLNVDGLGAKNLVKGGAAATALASGDLVSGSVYEVVYDGTQFQVLAMVTSTIYQPLDATLTAFAAQSTGADLLWYWSGTDAGATTAFGASARSWLAGTTLASYTMLYTDAGASLGPEIILDRNSASPAASDALGALTFQGRDSGGNSQQYGQIRAEITDPTNGSEDSRLVFVSYLNSIGISLYLEGGALYLPTLINKGAGTLNFTEVWENDVRVAKLNANTFTADQTITSTAAGAGVGPALDLYRNSASPAALDVLGAVTMTGKSSTGVTRTYGSITGLIGSPTNGAETGGLLFNTIQAGTTTNRLNLLNGLYTPNATSGDKGADTINAKAVYDDNVLLTDYVFDAYLGGEHAPYTERVQQKADELDAAMFEPAAYAEFWRANRRLYGMPDLNDCIDGMVKEHSLGAMVQKLWQTVELQAILIENLRQQMESK